MRFFRIVDAFNIPRRWYLGSPISPAGIEVDSRSFTEGREYKGESRLLLPIDRGSEPLDFTLGSFDMPIVKAEIAAKLELLAPGEIQWIPVTVVGSRTKYEVMNVLTVMKIINEGLSEITRWTASDGVPSRVGTYAGIGKLVLNRAGIGSSRIFRLKDWELPLIVSENIKNYLEVSHATGIAFEEIQVV
jgi:hypothetical protein